MMKKYLSTIFTFLLIVITVSAYAGEIELNNSDIYIDQNKISIGESGTSDEKTELTQTARKFQIKTSKNDGTSFIQFCNSDDDCFFSISDTGIIQSILTYGFTFIDPFTLSDYLYHNVAHTIYTYAGLSTDLATKFDNSGNRTIWFKGDKDGSSSLKVLNSDDAEVFAANSDGALDVVKNIDTADMALHIQDYSLQGSTASNQTALIETYTDRPMLRLDSVIQSGKPMIYAVNSQNATRRPDLAPTFVGQADYLWLGSLDIATPFYKWLYTGEELWLASIPWKKSHNGAGLNPAFQWRTYGANTADFRWQNPNGYVDLKKWDNGGSAGLEYTSSATAVGGLKISTGAGELNLAPAGNFIAKGFTYPSTDGTAGQAITTNGSKVLGFTDVATPTDLLNYALLAGRAGGQTLNGGSASGDNLVLQSNTSNDGQIKLVGDTYFGNATTGILFETDAFTSPTQGNQVTFGVSGDTINQFQFYGFGQFQALDSGMQFQTLDPFDNLITFAPNATTQFRVADGYAEAVNVLQTPSIRGGTGSGDDLTLTSTSNATKGSVNIGSLAEFDEVNGNFNINGNSGAVAISDISVLNALTDMGVVFDGGGSIKSGLYTEVNGEVLSLGINTKQYSRTDTARVGGIFRLDSRTSVNTFSILGNSIGDDTSSSPTDRFVVNLDTGNIILNPVKGKTGVNVTPIAQFHVKGSGNTSATTGFLVENSDATDGLAVRDDGVISGSQIRTNFGNSVFLGQGAGLVDDGTSNKNVGIGVDVLTSNTTGFNNTSAGYQSSYSNITGYGNTANGYQSFYSNTSGYYNSANGRASLYNITTGNNNTANGYQSGRYIADGITPNQTSSTSLYLGTNTKALADGDTNENVIGYEAIGNGSNTTTIGNSSITDTYLAGNLHDGTFNYPTADGIAGAVMTTDGSGNLSLLAPAYGEVYQTDNSTATTINTVDVWEEIDNFTTGLTQGVNAASGSLTLGTGQDGVYSVAVSLSGVPASVNKDFEFAISVNDAIQTKTKQSRYFTTTTIAGAVSLHGLLSLSAGDVVKLELRNISDDTDFTVINSNIVMHRID